MLSSTAKRETPADRDPFSPVPAWLRRSRWRWLWWSLIGVTLLVAVAAELGWWDLTATTTNYAGAHFNQGDNATWIQHSWVGDFHTAADYAALADHLRREQITYVYAHVGPLDGDGTIPPARYPFAVQFIQAMHQDEPDLRVLAWIGQVYQLGAPPGSDKIDLSAPQTRAQTAQTAAIFTALGFDGIHYDIEPIPDNDNHFLDLLDETRAAIGPHKLLSIATPNWVPIARVVSTLQSVVDVDRGNDWWTTYYYLAVSSHVDQMVVMMYNTDMPTAPLYEMIVEQETAHILRAVERGSASTQVLVGIPAFQGNSRAFHSSAENMRTGLTGVTDGLNYSTFHNAFGGVAIYPDWLTTAADWSTYDHLWLGK